MQGSCIDRLLRAADRIDGHWWWVEVARLNADDQLADLGDSSCWKEDEEVTPLRAQEDSSAIAKLPLLESSPQERAAARDEWHPLVSVAFRSH